MSLHGMSKDGWKRFETGGEWEYDISQLGYKYNMTDISASFGLWQFQFLEEWRIKRKEIVSIYQKALSGIDGIKLPIESKADIHLPLDLKIGRCSMVVAGISGTAKEDYRELSAVRIATKYPRITTEYFTQRGVPVEIIYLSGSVELAPVLGLAERIVDLVSTGQTLADNGLQIIEKICDISVCLVVNRASYQIKHRAITGLIELLEKSSPIIKS